VSHPIPPTVWPEPPQTQPPHVEGGPGSLPPSVMPPIYIPNPPPENGSIVEWHAVWTPVTGWAVVGTINPPHPTPGK
jgi:hypothetical protein